MELDKKHKEKLKRATEAVNGSAEGSEVYFMLGILLRQVLELQQSVEALNEKNND